MRHFSIRVLFAFAAALSLCGCSSDNHVARSNPSDAPGAAEATSNAEPRAWPAAGDVLHTRVGTHFEARRGRYHAYSTNHIGLPKHLTPGSQLTFDRSDREHIYLHDDQGSEYVITFVAKHSLMSIGQWIGRQFSREPIAVPSELTDDEREHIAESRVRRGMSRQAVFLAIGYPPKSLSPSPQDDLLTYEWRRFRPYRVRFDKSDRVVRLGR